LKVKPGIAANIKPAIHPTNMKIRFCTVSAICRPSKNNSNLKSTSSLNI
jgi:hypothetical protein